MMFGLALSFAILTFGFYLKSTTNPGLQSSKKLAWVFIILGIITYIGKLTIMFLNKKQ